MKNTEKNKIQQNLEFKLHRISISIENLRFSIIYQNFTGENCQDYIKILIEQIKDSNLEQFLNK